MKGAVKIFGFTILVVVFYSYVGQMVPQQRAYPPETTELSADLTTDEMVEVGQEIVRGKGTCLTCHTVGSGEGGGRFPDLGNIGAIASERRDGYSDIEYLAESLYEPNTHVVEGYNPGMPQVSTPPIGLTDPEIKAVIAYLQSLGGTPTVTMDTELGYEQSDGGGGGQTAQAGSETGGAAAGGDAESGEAPSGEALFSEYMCGTCHTTDGPTQMVGPSLYDVGNRMSRAEIYEAIMEPDATVREGFPAGTMTATLKGAGFYSQVSAQELQTLVDYLASQTGE